MGLAADSSSGQADAQRGCVVSMARYDESPPREIFPGIPNMLSTGAPGSQGISASETSGAVIGTPVVSVPGLSSQLPEGRPTVPVRAGDSGGGSDDVAAHTGPTLQGPQSAYLSTGSGDGSTMARNPNSGA